LQIISHLERKEERKKGRKKERKEEKGQTFSDEIN